MMQFPDRRSPRTGTTTPDAAAAFDATWAIYEGAADTCREVQAAFDDALEVLRAVGKPDQSQAVSSAARSAVDILHALEMAELIRRRAAYEAIVATAGVAAADRRQRREA